MQDSARRLPPAPLGAEPRSTVEHRQLRRARQGDDAAFAALVERHDEVLRSLTARLVGVDDMDETLATAYLKAYRALPRLGEGTTTHAWLYRITYMVCLDVLRREWRRTNRRPHRSRRHGPGTTATARASGSHPSMAAARDVGAAVEDLPADQRAVLLLVDRHAVSPGDVAAMLDVAPRQVAALLVEARSAVEQVTGTPLSTGAGDDGEDGVDGPPSGDDPADADADAGTEAGAVARSTTPDDTPPGPRPRPLQGLSVPAHGTRFWHDLGTQLLAERAAPAMPPPSVRRTSVAPAPTRPEPIEEPPVALVQLVRRADRLGHRRRRSAATRRRCLMAAATVAVVAVVAVALRIGGNAEPPLEKQGLVAQEVAARVSERLAGLVGLRATVDVRQVVADGSTRRTVYTVVLGGNGSFRLSRDDADHVITYDAATDTRRERQVVVGPDGPVVVARETTGFAGGLPDAAVLDLDVVTADVRAALRAVRGEERRLAASSSVAGRRAWAIEAPLPTGVPGGADVVRLSVDQDELLPVEVMVRDGDVPVRHTTFRDVVPNVAAPTGTFTSAFVAGDPVERVDGGYASVLLGDVPTRVGFEPLRPAYLPAGFTLDAARLQPEGKVVSMRYRRGFEQVVVSTRPSPVAVGEAWPDPFPRLERARPAPATVSSGALLGSPVALAAGAFGEPQLWGSNGLLAATVVGDVTAEELTRIAESLR